MTNHVGVRSARGSFATLVALFTVLSSSKVNAQECTDDGDCIMGFECVHETNRGSGGSGGFATVTVSTSIGGSSSSECGDDECQWDEEYDSCPDDCDERTYCSATECESNDDCAEGYLCAYAGSVSVSSSSGGENYEMSYQCRPRGEACSSDDDCEADYHCVLVTSSGSSSATTDAGDGVSGSASSDASSGGSSGFGGSGTTPGSASSGDLANGVCVHSGTGTGGGAGASGDAGGSNDLSSATGSSSTSGGSVVGGSASSGDGSGGTSADGSGGNANSPDDDDGGCSCSLDRPHEGHGQLALLAVAAGLVRRRKRTRQGIW